MRLTAWYACVFALVLALFAVLTYLLFVYTLQNHTDETLNEIAGVFETTANRELADEDKASDPTKTDEAVRDAATELGFINYQIFAFAADNRLISATKAADSDTQISPTAAASQLEFVSAKTADSFSDFENERETFRLFFYRFELQGQTYKLLVVHPLDDRKELLGRVRYAFLISVPLVLLAASFGGYFLAKKSLEPISAMGRTAEAITARNLHDRLPVVNERDELGSLATKFNELLSRLDASFEQQRRFMADASHELRTPVAIVRSEADVILGKESREESEYRDSFSIVQSEAERMTRIIEELFMLARVDAGQRPVGKEALYLDDVLTESVTAFRTIARERDLMLELDAPDEMRVSGDPLLLARLFANLIDNALKHACSFVKISARVVNDRCEVEVRDDGHGIPKEAQPHIFERFYRADRSRSRNGDVFVGAGAGLGLAISRWIAESHDGELSLLSTSDTDGTVFRFVLPRTDPV